MFSVKAYLPVNESFGELFVSSEPSLVSHAESVLVILQSKCQDYTTFAWIRALIIRLGFYRVHVLCLAQASQRR